MITVQIHDLPEISGYDIQDSVRFVASANRRLYQVNYTADASGFCQISRIREDTWYSLQPAYTLPQWLRLSARALSLVGWSRLAQRLFLGQTTNQLVVRSVSNDYTSGVSEVSTQSAAIEQFVRWLVPIMALSLEQPIFYHFNRQLQTWYLAPLSELLDYNTGVVRWKYADGWLVAENASSSEVVVERAVYQRLIGKLSQSLRDQFVHEILTTAILNPMARQAFETRRYIGNHQDNALGGAIHYSLNLDPGASQLAGQSGTWGFVIPF